MSYLVERAVSSHLTSHTNRNDPKHLCFDCVRHFHDFKISPDGRFNCARVGSITSSSHEINLKKEE